MTTIHEGKADINYRYDRAHAIASSSAELQWEIQRCFGADSEAARLAAEDAGAAVWTSVNPEDDNLKADPVAIVAQFPGFDRASEDLKGVVRCLIVQARKELLGSSPVRQQ